MNTKKHKFNYGSHVNISLFELFGAVKTTKLLKTK